MPIYEYVCTECEHKLEALQKMSDAPLSDCPACAKPNLKKLISAPSFRLSGSGWYETDFKSGNQKNLTNSDTGDKAASSDKAANKKDDKAASKKDDKAGSKKDAKTASKKDAKAKKEAAA